VEQLDPLPGWDDAHDARIVVVDDLAANAALLQRILEREGYRRLTATARSAEAIPLCRQEPTDLLLLDLHMPQPDGFEILAELGSDESDPPVVVLTADESPEARIRALQAGARDFLAKPFDPSEVLLRIRNVLEIEILHRRLSHHNDLLERTVEHRTRELEEAQRETLSRLALLAEYRDDTTGQHVQRVGRLCRMLALQLGLPDERAELIGEAAKLHDIGKIGVPDAILLKPERLTEAERTQMQEHVRLAGAILAGSRSELLQLAELIAASHHERWDGRGYPNGLAGDEIPLEGCITAVADVFDALTDGRPYKPPWSIEKATEEICTGSGRQFHPGVVEAFLALDPESLITGPASSPRAR
jgi:putative two-component system response regulator